MPAKKLGSLLEILRTLKVSGILLGYGQAPSTVISVFTTTFQRIPSGDMQGRPLTQGHQ